ncbi:diguanylate cyclase domain-containing protein [Marinobacter sp. KMM 10035]|uniref:diguanylate cyclase domain-containing protein n=1 Tax=Marinobacter sp. KMM 10035 TaxID=3134034 RepID=UPI0039780540
MTRNGRYMGLGSTRSLLRMMTWRWVEQAKHANPLSQLPGNVLIQQEAMRRLQKNEVFACIYFDIDHFKPFNDVMGYGEGDEVILSLARQLCAVFDGDTDWVGHIGGDDFVVYSGKLEPQKRCEQVQNLFKSEALSRYPAAMRKARSMTAEDRDGQLKRFPLVALSAGIVIAESRSFGSAADLAANAADAKAKAKKSAGGIHIVRSERVAEAEF